MTATVATSVPRAKPGGSLGGPAGGRRWLLAGLTILAPFALLAVAEGALRAAGVGGTPPLFAPVEDAPRYLHAHRRAVERLLPGGEAPSLWIHPVPFRRDKAPGTLRLFVQGGSTAAGYPYGHGASLAGLLDQRLQRTYPDLDVEVVTTAVSAVNSYALLDFSGEILEQRPDGVLIYAGHNEYLGLLGVGSGYSPGRRRPVVLASLAVRDVRLVQLAGRGWAALTPGTATSRTGSSGEAGGGRGRTLMARIVGEKHIPLGSPLYHRGLGQLRTNLRALLARYRRAGVPVWIATVASNLRDHPPFVAGHGPGASAAERAAWRRNHATGDLALAQGDAAAALVAFDAAVATDDLHARGHFGRGRALEELGRFAEARSAYAAARDRDELRFRAPSEVNRVIRRVAAEEGARVVDVEAALEAAAPHGLIGDDLMLEHLHPNLEGYLLLADAFYRALMGEGPPGIGVVSGAGPQVVALRRARREMPVTEVDRLYGEWRIGRLTSDWPFPDEPQPYRPPRPEGAVERIADGYRRGALDWPDAMRRLLDHHRRAGATAEAARVAAILAEAFPHRAEDQATAARLLAAEGRPDAVVYRRRAAGSPRPR